MKNTSIREFMKIVLKKWSFIDYITCIFFLWINRGVLDLFVHNVPALKFNAIFFIWLFLVFLENPLNICKDLAKCIPLGLMFIVIYLFYMHSKIPAFNGFLFNALLLIEIFMIFQYYYRKKTETINSIIKLLLFDDVFVVVRTLLYMRKVPYITRMLSVDYEIRSELFGRTSLGAGFIPKALGGYEFFYSIIFVLLIFAYNAYKSEKKRTSYVLLVFCGVIIELFSGFSIAVMLLIISIMLLFMFVRKQSVMYKVIVAIFILILVTVMNSVNVLDFLIKISPDVFVDKLIEIRTLLSGSVLGLGTDLGFRIDTYIKSFKTFKNNPIIGVGYYGSYGVGGHSTIIDFLAYFGVFSFFNFGFWIYFIIRQIKDSNLDTKPLVIISYGYFVILSIINTSYFGIIFLYAIVVFPYMLNMYQKEK